MPAVVLAVNIYESLIAFVIGLDQKRTAAVILENQILRPRENSRILADAVFFIIGNIKTVVFLSQDRESGRQYAAVQRGRDLADPAAGSRPQVTALEYSERHLPAGSDADRFSENGIEGKYGAGRNINIVQLFIEPFSYIGFPAGSRALEI